MSERGDDGEGVRWGLFDLCKRDSGSSLFFIFFRLKLFSPVLSTATSRATDILAAFTKFVLDMASNDSPNPVSVPTSSAPLTIPTSAVPKTFRPSPTSKLIQTPVSSKPSKPQLPSQQQSSQAPSSIKSSLPIQQPSPSNALVSLNPSSSPQPSISKSIAQPSPPQQLPPSTQPARAVQGPVPPNLAHAIPSNVPTRPTVAASATVPAKSPSHSSIALEIARLITDFLGPNYSRRDAVGGTLSGLRTRLETDSAVFDSKREQLVWQVREAIRTEFFKIVYPAPPTQALLNLVATTETLLGAYQLKSRPFFFPGARVAVPTEAGSRRAGTTLQLRFKVVAEKTVTEALLHLDAPNGGTFQWVQTPALTPLIAYIQPQGRVQKPIPPQGSRRAAPRPSRGISRSRHVPRSRVGTVASRRKASVAQKTTSASHASAPAPAPAVVSKLTAPIASAPTKASTAASPSPTTQPPSPPPIPPTPTSLPPPPPSTPPPTLPQPPVEPTNIGPLALPPTFLPQSLLETGQPYQRRLREGASAVTFGSGSLRRALDVKEDEGARDTAKKIKRLIGVERLVARRKVEEVEYFVKWCGRSMKEGSWERRAALMVDVPGLVLEFDTRHPDLPKVVCHSDRVKSEEEMRMKKGVRGSDVERINGEGTGIKSGNTSGKEEEKNVMEMVANAMDDIEKNSTSSELKIATSKAPTTYVDEVTGIRIPPYLDTPILELSFSGMLLQIRQPNEYVLHNDASSASRDYKKRQSRFKQENLPLGGRLFLLSKTEAKSALDASLRSHKAYGRHPIPFPRGIGHVSPADTGVPFSGAVVEAAPPSWERYFTSLGLHAKRFERNLPPFFPSIDGRGAHKLALAARDIVHERAVEHRERARRVVRMAYRHGQIADSPACLFRDRQRRPGECTDCFPIETPTKGKNRPSRVPPPSEQLVKGSDTLVAKALANVKKLENGRWFDAHWSCWRSGNGPSVED